MTGPKSDFDDTSWRVRSVPCPHCGAKVGEECHTPSGNPIVLSGKPRFHSTRVTLGTEPLRTKTGRVLTDDDIQALADEAEIGYDVSHLDEMAFLRGAVGPLPRNAGTMNAENDGEQKMAAALKPFGWTCGPDFWKRYYTDAWVFNLANAVERLTDEVARYRAARQ